MPQPLPRFEPDLQADDAAKVDRVVAETAVLEEPASAAGATAPGDSRRLRGIPAVGRGCSGTIAGTDPVQALLSKERRRVAPRAPRTATVARAVEAPHLFACGVCGVDLELSARNARAHRTNGTRPRCRRCRYGSKPPAAMRRWWLARFSEDELVQLASAIWAHDRH